MSVEKRASLVQNPLLLLDGGLGTTLEDQHGVKFSHHTPLWSSHLLITSPSCLQRVHSAFADAGADIILTATYQASFAGFSRTRLDPAHAPVTEAKQYMLSAIHLARSAYNSRPGLVALSLGAYGATLVPSAEYSGAYGSVREVDLVSFHRDRLSIFLNSAEAWAEVDLVAFETIPRLDEIRAAIAVMAGVPERLRKPYWISCVFPNTDEALPDGSQVPAIVSALLSNATVLPFAIGINCTKVHKLPNLIQSFEKAIETAGSSFPRLVLYPDGASHQRYDPARQQWLNVQSGERDYEKTWEDELSVIVLAVRARAKWAAIIVGGCCKTTPTHITNLRHTLGWEAPTSSIIGAS